MKQGIHPNYHEINVTCSCGNKFVTKSAMEKDSFNVEVCSLCHPFYTGTQKIVDTTGRVDKFNNKFGNLFKRSLPLCQKDCFVQSFLHSGRLKPFFQTASPYRINILSNTRKNQR